MEVNFDLLSILTSLFGTFFPFLTRKKEVSEIKKMYEQIRFDVAQALTMYACYYHNPVDLADCTDNKLPPRYSEASEELRRLASKVAALSETLPEKVKGLPITAGQMADVSHCLIGLSHSMTTPYNQGERSAEANQAVCVRENKIRNILNIQEPNRE